MKCENSQPKTLSAEAGVVCLVIAARLTAYACLQGSAISTPLVNQRTNGHGLCKGVIKPSFGVIKRGYVQIFQRANNLLKQHLMWESDAKSPPTPLELRSRGIYIELLLWIALSSFVWEKARKIVGAKEWRRGLKLIYFKCSQMENCSYRLKFFLHSNRNGNLPLV